LVQAGTDCRGLSLPAGVPVGVTEREHLSQQRWGHPPGRVEYRERAELAFLESLRPGKVEQILDDPAAEAAPSEKLPLPCTVSGLPTATAAELQARSAPHDRASAIGAALLLSHVWGYDYDPGSNVVDVYIGYLRRKLGSESIETVRGMGYRLTI
jgi:hypothetical protein